MGMRRKAREFVLQTLFSIEFNKNMDMPQTSDYITKFREIVDNSNRKHTPEIDDFAISILNATLNHLTEIDERIQNHLINWSILNMGLIEKTILRMAIAEMFYIKTPYQIVINEAVEIAKRYASDSIAKFVNGILDNIKNEI